MIKPVKIEVHRGEGPQSECDGKWHAFSTFREAEILLSKWAQTAPKKGGYDKCDFKVTYEDGETYDGRADITHEHRFGYSLSRHMNDFLTFYAGTRCPPHMKQEDYEAFLARERRGGEESIQKSAAEFLAKYQIGDAS